MKAAPIRFNVLVRAAPPHSDDDGTGQDRVGQAAEPSKGNSAVGGYFLCLDRFAAHDAAAGYGTSSMTGIEEAADFFVVLGLGAKDSIDLVKEDRRLRVVVAYFPEEIGRGDVDGFHRRRHHR